MKTLVPPTQSPSRDGTMRGHTAFDMLSRRALRVLCGGVLLLGVACLPRAAWADCQFIYGTSATSVTFNAGTITLTPSTTIGQVLWTSSTAAPANPPQLICYNNPTNWGITNIIAAQPAAGSTLFPTGIPGISYRILHPDTTNFLPAYPTPNADPSGTYSVTSNLQLIYTGPYLPPNNSTLTGQLAQWQVDIFACTGHGRNQTCATTPQPVEYFNINAIINIQVPTCDVDPNSVSKVVTLPAVTTAQLATNQTPGSTPFSLQLVKCPTGQKVFINLNTSSPYAGGTGVIAPSGAGYANNVGVQILNADGSTPVTFGDAPAQAINEGTTAGSNFTINLYARYYRTGTPAGAGTVKGIATYTLNYQ